jgi:dsRNA-specific ribonuclease
MAGMVAPSLVWRVQSMLLAVEARDRIAAHLPKKTPLRDISQLLSTSNTSVSRADDSDHGQGRCALPCVSLMLRAITPTMTLEAMDSERLEFLGDTILKCVTSWALFMRHPDQQEGFLTTERMLLVSNAYQTAQAKTLDLAQYLRVLTLSRGKQELLFAPCGRSLAAAMGEEGTACSLWNQDIRTGKSSLSADGVIGSGGRSSQHAVGEVKAKKLADMLEAVIGAFYEADGLEAATAVVRAFNLWPQEVPMSISSSPATTTSSASDCMSTGKKLGVLSRSREGPPIIPRGYPPQLERIALGFRPASRSRDSPVDFASTTEMTGRALDISLRPLCEAIGYSFTDLSLLEEALTHCSVPHKPSNQRMEFLGDAVLDLAVMSVLYEASLAATQGTLSALKHKLLSNRHLALIAVDLGLHRHMFVFSAALVSQFGEISLWKEAHDCRDEAGEFVLASGFDGGKVLADCLEALFAAVFIDSQCSMKAVRGVVKKIGVIPPEVFQDADTGYAASAVM